MVRTPAKKKPKTDKVRQPGLPQHNLPEPYATLQKLGYEEDVMFYLEIQENTAEEDLPGVISKLIDIAHDETYYTYSEVEDPDPDPRVFTPLQAIRALCYLCDDNLDVVPRLIPLFKTEDDDMREELPLLYACIGPKVVDVLKALTLDDAEEIYIREGAASALVELAEMHVEVVDDVVQIIEAALTASKDPELTAYFILNLLDMGSIESMPLIELAFQEARVDEEIISLADAKLHIESIVHPEEDDEEFDEVLPPDAPEVTDEDAEEVRVPFVAPEKVGRNDLCPCGSGKKYKKCHGSAAA